MLGSLLIFTVSVARCSMELTGESVSCAKYYIIEINNQIMARKMSTARKGELKEKRITLLPKKKKKKPTITTK